MKKYFLLSLVVVLLAAACTGPNSTQTSEEQATHKRIPVNQNKSQDTHSSDTTSWKTYRSQKDGFEIGYPSDWFAEECGLHGVIMGNDRIGVGHCGDAGPVSEGIIEIRLEDYPDIASAAKDYIQYFETVTQESVTVAQTPAVQLQGIIKQSPLGRENVRETIVFFPRDDKVLVLENDIQNNAYREAFYLILSTLKVATN